MASEYGRTNPEFFRGHHPDHLYPHPCPYPPAHLPTQPQDMHEVIRREIEKEKIREERIMLEIARKRILEAEVRLELLMERELARNRVIDGFPFASSPGMGLESPMRRSVLGAIEDGRSTKERISVSQVERERLNGRCEGGGFDTIPFQKTYLGASEVDSFMEGTKGKKRIIFLAKPFESISESKMKTVPPPGLDASETPSSDAILSKGAKEEWSCALCQVSATCERGLNEHLQGKRHKSKEAALRAERAGKNYSIGFFPKKASNSIHVAEYTNSGIEGGVKVKAYLPLKKTGEESSERYDLQPMQENPDSEKLKKIQSAVRKAQKLQKNDTSEKKEFMTGEASSRRDDIQPLQGNRKSEDLKAKQSKAQNEQKHCDSSKQELKTGKANSKNCDLQSLQYSQNPGNSKEKQSEFQKVKKNDDSKKIDSLFWCEICQIGTLSEDVMNNHKIGKKHARRVNNLGKCDETGGAVECNEKGKPAVLSHHAEGEQISKGRDLRPLQVYPNSKDFKKYRSDVQKAQKLQKKGGFKTGEGSSKRDDFQQLQDNQISDHLTVKDSEVQKVQEIGDSKKELKAGEANSKKYGLQTLQNSRNPDNWKEKQSEVQKVKRNDDSTKIDSTFCCEICQVGTLSEDVMNDHKNGKKHARHVSRLGKSDEMGGASQCNKEENPGNSTKKQSEVQKVKKNDDSKKLNSTFWCEICQVGTLSEDVMNDHKNGRKHARHVSSLGKSYGIGGAAQCNEKFKRRKRRKRRKRMQNESEVQKKKKNDDSKQIVSTFWCEISQVGTLSEDVMNHHKNGKKHARHGCRLVKTDETGVAAQLNEKENPCNPKEKQSEVQKLKKNDDSKKMDSTVWCEIFQVGPLSEDVINNHKNGKKHARHVGHLGESDETGGAAQCNEKENPGNSKEKQSEVQKMKMNADSKKIVTTFWCEICQVGTVSEDVMNNHKNGKKHARHVSRLGKSDETGGAAQGNENEELAVLSHHAEGVAEDGNTFKLDNIDQTLNQLRLEGRKPIDGVDEKKWALLSHLAEGEESSKRDDFQ